MSDNNNDILRESKERYSDKGNVRKKWLNQYGCLTEDNDFFVHRKCILEMFNLVEVVADNKLDEFRANATRMPDETIKGEINEVYDYNGQRVFFRPTKFFANKLFALKKIGYNIPADINHTIRRIRNETTHGNETVVREHIDLNYDFTRDIMLSFADCLIALNMLDSEDRIPSFDSLRIHEGSILRNGEYYAGRFLDENDSARIYESSHKRLGSKLIIKELKPDKYSKEIIQNEGAGLSKTKNNDSPQIYDVFSENGTYYIVMEYKDNIPLDDYLDEHGLSDNSFKQPEKNRNKLKWIIFIAAAGVAAAVAIILAVTL